MYTLIQVYGVNLISFGINLSAIFIYSHVAGTAGYGTYSIYVSYMSFYALVEFSLVKTALSISETATDPFCERMTRTCSFMSGSLFLISLLSIPLVLVSDALFPSGTGTGLSASFLAGIAFAEHCFSYPANHLIFKFSLEKQFTKAFIWRLFGTILRHGIAIPVLVFSNSLSLAIYSILAKGLLYGLASVIKDKTPCFKDSAIWLIPRIKDIIVLGSFLSTSVALMIIYELPGIYINYIYGRNALGSYRFVFDLVNAVWFLATVYPFLLFGYLLPKSHEKSQLEAVSRITTLSTSIALVHLVYFLIVWVGFSCAQYFDLDIPFNSPYAVGLVAGVCLMGYNRFLIEATQALGRAQIVLVATVVVIGFVTLSFVLVSTLQLSNFEEIGFVWFLGQLLFFCILKHLLKRRSGNTRRYITDCALPLVLSVAFVISPLLSATLRFIISIVGAALALIWLLQSLITLSKKVNLKRH